MSDSRVGFLVRPLDGSGTDIFVSLTRACPRARPNALAARLAKERGCDVEVRGSQDDWLYSTVTPEGKVVV